MMALSSEDEGASALFFANGRSATSTAYSTPTGSSLALVETKSELSAVHSDLELRLIQTFATYAGQQLVDSYLAVKNASRVTQLLGNTTEKLLTVTGVTAIVRFLFSQYQRVGGPLLGYVDEAMGRRIIDTVVSILLLAVEEDHKSAALALEAGGAIKLSREERVQALLRGEVPRLKALLDASYRQGYEEGVATVPEPVVMELKDFVPVEELVRVKDANREQVRELNHEMAALRASMSDLNKEKQRLEQRLIDVHNYRESERGQRFQEMEEELARTKLEANQKAHDLRRLELVVEAMRKKRKGKSSRSGKSTTSDEKNVSTA